MNTEKYMEMDEKKRQKRIIADNLKSVRQKYNMRRSEVSRKLEIPYRTLEDWEAGKSKPAKYVYNMYLKSLKDIQPLYTIYLDNEVIANNKTLDDVKEFFKADLAQCFDSKEEFEHFENFNREIRYSQNIDDIMGILEKEAAGEAVLYRIEREEE